jgi:hypothetical protein
MQGTIMTNRIDSLIQRATALALAAMVTLALLGSIDGLARQDAAPNALLAQQRASTPS